jgi:predicted metal-dependent phosphoesterase TrpH
MAGKENDLSKIDLHVHSRLSKNFEFEQASLDRLVELGRRRGLDGLALTEHIHAKNFWPMHENLRSHYSYHNGYYEMPQGFRVFSGFEMTVEERIDFIVVGELDNIEKLDKAFSPRLSEDNHVPGIEFLEKAKEHEVILLSAHPYRPGKETAKLPLDEVFGLVDGIEANGRDFGTEYRVAALAREYGRAVSGGSDAHYYLQVGVRSTVIPDDELTLDRIRAALSSRTTVAHCKPYTEQLVKLCKEIKNLAKLRKPAGNETVVAA